MFFGDFLGRDPERKRTPVTQSTRTKALMRSKGKCEKCRKHITGGVKPHIHHKDGDPTNNRLSNLKVLCPNCHSAAHDKPIRRKNTSNDNGFSLFGDRPFF
jgi:5-methylcytosine-specific restriction endonuclease McrA